MRQILTGCLALFASTTTLHSVSVAQIDLNSVVYIECVSPDGRIRQGSGVIVSNDGRILTAKHVVPRNALCKGVRGTGAKTPDRELVHGPSNKDYDAAIMRFVPYPGERFNPVKFTRLTPDMQGQSITAYGIPIRGSGAADRNSSIGTGQITARRGIISTTVPNAKGWIETDALTTRGMSGGPVILDVDKSLVGIVVGSVFDDPLTSIPTNYAVLAAQEVAIEFGLVASKTKRVLADSSSGAGKAKSRWVCETVPSSHYKFRLHKFEIYGDYISELLATVEFVRADNYNEKLRSSDMRNSEVTRISLHIDDWLNPDCDTKVRRLLGMNEEVSALCLGRWKGHTKVGVNPLIVYLQKRQSILDATRHIKLCVKGRGVTVENVGSED